MKKSFVTLFRKFLVLIALSFLPIVAQAHPMEIEFNEMISGCKYIFIAKFTHENSGKTKFDLEIESVLKGNYADKSFTAGRASGTPYLEKGKPFIAFINKEGELEWGGYADDLENGVISISGFYDFDAYDVFPGDLTMIQLKQYLKQDKFDGSLSGPLVIFNYRKQKFDTTKTNFTVTYTYHNNGKTTFDVTSSNLPLDGINTKPDVWTDGSSAEITYEENMVRPLEFFGYASDDPSDGKTYHAIFILKEPEHLDSTMFYQYIQNPAVGPIWYRMTITMADGTKYHMDRDRYSGHICSLVMGNDSIECATGGPPSSTDTSFYKFGDYWNPTIVLTLDKLKKGVKDTGEIGINNPDELELLEMTNFTGHLYVKENGVMVNKGKCKIALDGIYFSGNVNYGK